MKPVVWSLLSEAFGVPPSSGIAGDVSILLEVEQIKGYISGVARSLSKGDLKDLVIHLGLCGDEILGSASCKG